MTVSLRLLLLVVKASITNVAVLRATGCSSVRRSPCRSIYLPCVATTPRLQHCYKSNITLKSTYYLTIIINNIPITVMIYGSLNIKETSGLQICYKNDHRCVFLTRHCSMDHIELTFVSFCSVLLWAAVYF